MTKLKKVTKWWWAWNFKEEEEWLNSMASEGYTLEKAKGINYWFTKTEPGEYIIRLEYNKHDSDYIAFMEELGAEHISEHIGWNYYRRKSELGDFELFSDPASKIDHFERIEKTLFLLMFINLAQSLMNMCIISGTSSQFTIINIVPALFSMLLAMMMAFGYGCTRTERRLLEREKKLTE